MVLDSVQSIHSKRNYAKDAMNLAQAGKFSGLQSISPGQTWEESFWIKPSGF
jgi:hypothetical protein